MHELSLAESMLRIIEDTAAAQGLKRVHAVTLEIGKLAAVEADAMRFCFESVTRGSIAEGAKLQLIEIAGQGQCQECAAVMAMDEAWMLCPQCGSARVDITSGREMRVKDLEAE